MNRYTSAHMRAISLTMLASLLLGCSGEPSEPINYDQDGYRSQWVNPDATDAQIDALRNVESRSVKDWNAVVTNVREKEPFTIIDASYKEQTYYLAIFTADGRNKARQVSIKTPIVFSGELGPEQSITRTGARANAEFPAYPTRVVAGGVEISQPSEEIAAIFAMVREEREKQARRRQLGDEEAAKEESAVQACRDKVTKTLKYPVSGDYSWFQRQTRKESDNVWVYTDVVKALTTQGERKSARFVCTVTATGDSLRAKVEFLGDNGV